VTTPVIRFIYLGCVVVFGLIWIPVTFIIARATLRRSNWLIAMSDLGLFIQFRSYLNWKASVDGPTIVGIKFNEIRSIRIVKEQLTSPDVSSGGLDHVGHTCIHNLCYCEIECDDLAHSFEKVILAITAERSIVLFGKESRVRTLPVIPVHGGMLRINWTNIRPNANDFLKILPATIKRQPVIRIDFSRWDIAQGNELDELIRHLCEGGFFSQAVQVMRQRRSLDFNDSMVAIEQLFKNN
jgi:hypothetical protein